MMSLLLSSSLFWILSVLGNILLSRQVALAATITKVEPNNNNDEEMRLLNDEKSSFSRRMASIGSKSTNPTTNTITGKRARYPESNPHICLAFLSCCNRIDLLNHTLAGAIRHMEQDEPSYFNYEIAWVDNGSDAALTDTIKDTYQIEHALTLNQNMGLAYGMNVLIFNLCTAPYILLLEEDWLYLDDLVAPQTPQRLRAIATSVALLETLDHKNITSFDARNVMGVFLRHETYESFLSFPHADLWETELQVNLPKALPTNDDHKGRRNGNLKDTVCDDPDETLSNDDEDDHNMIADIDYRIFCADTALRTDNIWGSYTNGAGLYRRSDLQKIGRMYGEPGDAFHDRYVEGNYAYRAGLRNCHAALRLTDDRECTQISQVNCTGAFHHIGGGRGTRPMNAKGTTCDDPTWNFFGAPLYSKLKRYMEQQTGQKQETCSRQELERLRERKFRDQDSQEYREQTKRENEAIFRREREERSKIRRQAEGVLRMLETDPDRLRSQVSWIAGLSNDEIRQQALRLQRLADSPHPLPGFWDLHGRIGGAGQAKTKDPQ